MSKRIQLRRGTNTENDAFTGAVGEVTVDTTNNTLRVHDGTTAGGTALVKTTSASTTTQGLIQIATQSEVNAGADSTKALVPSTLIGGIRAHLNVADNVPMYTCRAWVNFDGTGTVAIRASGNVSSVTDNGTGDYTVNFSTNMWDSNYCVVSAGTGSDELTTTNPRQGPSVALLTRSDFRVYTGSDTATKADWVRVCLAVFR